jgi:16S rRNA (cytosine967-C5)-methyltransferase
MKARKPGPTEPSEVRNAVLSILIAYDEGGGSLRSKIRGFIQDFSGAPNVISNVEYMAMHIVHFLNTIDYVLSSGAKGVDFKGISIRHRNMLRIALYETRWLGIPRDEALGWLPQTSMNLGRILRRALQTNLEEAIKRLSKPEQLSLQHSHPSFIVKTLLDHLAESDVIAMMKTNNKPGPTYVRANKFLSDTQETLSVLSSLDVDWQAESDLPGVFKVRSGIDKIVQSEYFLNNKLLAQDKASVYAAMALTPEPNDFVWDACAAPGMKTQLMWELMNARGRLVATEYNQRRFAIAKSRSSQMGPSGIEWILGDAVRCPVMGANKILIDAPCSSTGMIRGHPSYKWRLNRKTLSTFMTIQNKILEGILNGYSGAVNTEIVYATCSILPHEGESQIDSVLSRFPVELLDIPHFGTAGYSGFKCAEHVRRLFPHIHDTDGFFIAKMRIMQ